MAVPQPEAPQETPIRDQVIRNQTRAAVAWSDTAEDMVLNDLIREREQIRDSRWQIAVLAALAVIILIVGSVWTYRNVMHDRATDFNRAAAESNPFQPESINRVK